MLLTGDNAATASRIAGQSADRPRRGSPRRPDHRSRRDRPVRRARRVVTANLIIAAVFITGLVLWDLIGTLPLPLGVAGHEGSTVIVGLNGLRLLRRAAWTRATRSQPTR
ncbi:hypothetical protein [Amycolatopsis benzoatilytica]|uniref:hypothetical protein n=1 Tax=Amycolatopsis benzoatilytica TaxID=346045 RepID=UPI0003AB29F1